MKRLTREQLQSRKDRAVRFLRDVVGDDERADEVARESLESYAERRQFALVNPRRRCTQIVNTGGSSMAQAKRNWRIASASLRRKRTNCKTNSTRSRRSLPQKKTKARKKTARGKSSAPASD